LQLASGSFSLMAEDVFAQQLLGAWRAVGLDAAPRVEGDKTLTFCCPRCAAPERLEIGDGIVLCAACDWGATGEPWAIAQAGVKARPDPARAESEAALAALLARCRFEASTPPDRPVPLYSLAGQPIATAENLMVVQAKMKAGKSAAIGAMMAATMEPTGDCLWFSAANPSSHAVVHFDTEQSRFDHYQLIVRSLRRAGRTTPPPWLYSYHIKGQSIAVMRRLLPAALERAQQECGGVHSCIIDGIGDLCADVNDAAEANALVAELEALAMRHHTLLVCVLHENHGSENGKTRGHLGSQLARKAETNLRLEKDEDGQSILFADTSRSVHIPRKNAPAFRWCDEAKTHVSIQDSGKAYSAHQAKQEMKVLAEECFQGAGPEGLSWAAIIEQIRTRVLVGQTKAEKLLRQMAESLVVEKKDSRYFKK